MKFARKWAWLPKVPGKWIVLFFIFFGNWCQLLVKQKLNSFIPYRTFEICSLIWVIYPVVYSLAYESELYIGVGSNDVYLFTKLRKGWRQIKRRKISHHWLFQKGQNWFCRTCLHTTHLMMESLVRNWMQIKVESRIKHEGKEMIFSASLKWTRQKLQRRWNHLLLG